MGCISHAKLSSLKNLQSERNSDKKASYKDSLIIQVSFMQTVQNIKKNLTYRFQISGYRFEFTKRSFHFSRASALKVMLQQYRGHCPL